MVSLNLFRNKKKKKKLLIRRGQSIKENLAQNWCNKEIIFIFVHSLQDLGTYISNDVIPDRPVWIQTKTVASNQRNKKMNEKRKDKSKKDE